MSQTGGEEGQMRLTTEDGGTIPDAESLTLPHENEAIGCGSAVAIELANRGIASETEATYVASG
jgi:hypothetical protein